MTTSKPNSKSYEIYLKIKNDPIIYNEEIHCAMIIEVMSDPNKGSMSAFCKEAMIGDRTFYKWKNKHPLFDECYRYGAMVSKANWEEEGRLSREEEHFNIEYWRILGSARYGVGKSNRVRIDVDSTSNPYEQYQQLINQACEGDFTAPELKQLMESINVGTRTYESFQLQKEVDKMKEDLLKMEQAHGNHSVSTETTS